VLRWMPADLGFVVFDLLFICLLYNSVAGITRFIVLWCFTVFCDVCFVRVVCVCLCLLFDVALLFYNSVAILVVFWCLGYSYVCLVCLGLFVVWRALEVYL